ncbi:hypothetical protein [Planctomicrobium sp. SH664]|uniref:hypothetical protein n=1 Tax=Planctomicrobium sp. SH664 TaxID=3448125 RepID=UPI003F5C1619
MPTELFENTSSRTTTSPRRCGPLLIVALLLVGAGAVPSWVFAQADTAAPAATQEATDRIESPSTPVTEGGPTGSTPAAAPSTATTAPAVATQTPAPESIPVTLRPYDVQVLIRIDADPAFPYATRNQIVAQTEAILTARFRQMWSLKQELVTSLPVSGTSLSSWTDAAVLERFELVPEDKVFFVTVQAALGSYTIHCREWDTSSRTLSSEYIFSTVDRRELPALIANAVTDAFRPLAEIEVLEGNRIEFLVRAGELFPADPTLAPFQPGDYLVPYLRYLDRKKELRMIQLLPWTYLKVDAVQRSRLVLSLISTFRSPIPATRRRMEVMAMRIRPHLPATEVHIAPRGDLVNPLVGYRCELLNRNPTDQDPVEDRLKLITDRRGIVTVPVIPEHPLQYLHVFSGEALLARIPLIPGNVPELLIEVPDDRARLNVEGEVSLLQTELIDLVATREVLMSRARAAAAANRWSEVDRFLGELSRLPTLVQFVGRIETLQVQAVYKAQQAKDKVAEARIKRLCESVRKSAEKHLDPLRISDFRRDVNLGRPK